MPIKQLRNWTIHSSGVRVLITITEQVTSSPGLPIPAADGALAPVSKRSLHFRWGAALAATTAESGRKDAQKEAEAFSKYQRGHT